jgi:hypothetical protein
LSKTDPSRGSALTPIPIHSDSDSRDNDNDDDDDDDDDRRAYGDIDHEFEPIGANDARWLPSSLMNANLSRVSTNTGDGGRPSAAATATSSVRIENMWRFHRHERILIVSCTVIFNSVLFTDSF